jgi:protein-S-isoprenylcysteine O-methyltransferase Ste14
MLVALALDVALLAIGVGGPAALLHHRRALALLGLWIVSYPLLTVMRPTRGAPREEVRPDPSTVLLLTLIPLVTPMLSAIAERRGIWPLPGGEPLRWAGVAISAAGLALRIAAMHRLGSRFAPVVAIERGHRLETGGVYSRVRHPGYVGAWLANFGIVLAFGSAATLPLALAMAFVQWRRVVIEEQALEHRFGEEYRAYRGRTGRFFPKF